MSTQRLIFHWGFGISAVLLIAAVAAGADDAVSSYQMRNLTYGEMDHVSVWAGTIYLALNLPVVVIGIVVAALICRIFALPVPVALVLWPVLCLYLSAYWWLWLSERLTRVLAFVQKM